MPASVTDAVVLCDSDPCSTRACVGGIHLPDSPFQVVTYRTAKGTAFHLDAQCSRAVGDLTKDTSTFSVIEDKLCSLCGHMPRAVDDYRTSASRFSQQARRLLAVATSHDGALDSVDTAIVLGAAKTLASKSWPAPLDQVASDLIARAEDLTGVIAPGWLPRVIGTDVALTAAALLIGVDDDPQHRIGQRPRTPADRQAAELWPSNALDGAWQQWLTATDRNTIRGVLDDAFPGRSEAWAALHEQWSMMAEALAAKGEAHIVLVPRKELRSENVGGRGVRPTDGEALVEMIAEHALCAVPAPSGRWSSSVAVVVPEVVARLLPRLNVSGLADLGGWQRQDHPALMQTALGLWDGDRLSALRECITTARALLEGEPR